jgi:hypothetical protein
MLEVKRPLDLEDIEAQTVMELPDRELLLTLNQNSGDQTGLVNLGNVGIGLCNVQVIAVDSSQNC